MKNLLRTSSALLLILTLSSCGSIPSTSTYDAPPEPGQTTFQTQRNNQDNNVPEPGQTEMKSSDDNDVAEPGQTEMR